MLLSIAPMPQQFHLMMCKGSEDLEKILYTTDAQRIQICTEKTELGKILIEDARHADEYYLMFIDPGENEPYIPILPKTELELLQEENASLKVRVVRAEQVASETSLAQQELLELLIEVGVI